MAYVSLYRRYRPQSFADVVGQRHVTETLANAIREDRLHHAYLFTGPRGTGKTSTARILAKALNCVEGPTPEPCQTCAICVSVTDGSAVDVVELDMASHGGVDDARDLRERALFAPAVARRKVYILDEVHMASNAAFNALLKLIEEPPGHVLFAMATTEPQKVLPTIMSRVQRLDLRRVGQADVAGHIARIAEQEGATLDDEAVEAIVRAGDGSVRDTLSILEQVLAYAGREVGADDVAQLLGHTPAERVFDAVDLLAAADLRGLFSLVQDLLDGGHDLRRFALDLAAHLRDLLVLDVAPDRPDLVDASPQRRERLVSQAGTLPRDRVVAAIDAIGDALTEMRRGPARLPLEMTLAGLVTPVASPAGLPTPPPPRPVPTATAETEAGPAPGSAREAARAAAAAASSATPPPPRPGEQPSENPTAEDGPPDVEVVAPDVDAAPDVEGAPDDDAAPSDAAPAPEATVAPTEEPALELTLANVAARWDQVLEVVKRESPRVQAICAPCAPGEVTGGALVVDFPAANRWHAEELGKPENSAILTAAVEQVVGHRLDVRTRLGSDDGGDDGPPPPSAVEVEAAEIVEAELAGAEEVDEEEATARADALLRDELGAVPVDEHHP